MIGPAHGSVEPPMVPIRYSGRWIAWDRAEARIIADGATAEEALRAAVAAGETEPILARVPRADARFMGASR